MITREQVGMARIWSTPMRLDSGAPEDELRVDRPHEP
jgi:hypothetical protein